MFSSYIELKLKLNRSYYKVGEKYHFINNKFIFHTLFKYKTCQHSPLMSNKECRIQTRDVKTIRLDMRLRFNKQFCYVF